MNCSIIYCERGRIFKLDGRTVTESEYRAATESADRARLNEMFAAGVAPYCVSDATYMKGHCNGNQFEKSPHIGDAYKRVAEEAGVNTTGKRYLSGLARPGMPGDPEAWISGRGDIQRVLEKRGWGSGDGSTVKVKARESLNPPVSKRPDIADDIVNEKVSEILADLPAKDIRRVDVTDLREQVREKFAPPKHLRKKK